MIPWGRTGTRSGATRTNPFRLVTEVCLDRTNSKKSGATMTTAEPHAHGRRIPQLESAMIFSFNTNWDQIVGPAILCFILDNHPSLPTSG